MGLNLWVAAQWLGLEYTQARESIEWAYLGLARYILEHGLATIYGDAEWFPYWYGGVPFENTYPPLLHYLVAALSALSELSVGRAYHVVTAGFYCLGSVGVWLLAWRWTSALWPSVFAAAFYSLLSPCSWLMPSIAGDLNGYWMNQRLSALARYGEGPHVVSLALIPFALLAVDWALDRFDWRRVGIAAMACAAVPLSNIIGGFALAFGVLALVAAKGGRAWLYAPVIGGWAYLMALRWLHPATIADLQRNAQFVGGSFLMDRWHYLFLAGLAVVTCGVAIGLRQVSGAAKTSGFLVPMAAIPLAWEYFSFYFAPQPHRYHLEMDLGIALLLAFGLSQVPRAWMVSVAGLGALTVFGFVAGRELDRHIQPMKFEESWDLRITRWMANYDPAARVYFQGTPRFFAGVKYDQVQFGGGFINGLRIPIFFLADYGITAYKGDGKLTSAWLKALGVDYVAVGDETTEDPFRPWQAPRQFDGLLTEVWRERGDAIYWLGRRNESLAHAIPRGALMDKLPVSYLESDQLMRYVEAMESEASHGGVLQWVTPSRARIEAAPEAGDAVSVQIAHDSRWTAKVEGEVWPIQRDALGWMWIEPRKAGPIVVELEFHTPKWMLVICGVAWLIFLGALSQFRFPFTRI